MARVAPSAEHRRLLQLLANGCEIALYPGGSYRCRQTGEVVSAAVLRACLRQQWISGMPDFPLFAPEACRLTPLGRAVLGERIP
jgi:hypothetical protein